MALKTYLDSTSIFHHYTGIYKGSLYNIEKGNIFIEKKFGTMIVLQKHILDLFFIVNMSKNGKRS